MCIWYVAGVAQGSGAGWTVGRRVWGNVLPLLFAMGPLFWAVQVALREGPSPTMWLALGVFFVTGWVATAVFGLVGNADMRNEVGAKLHEMRPFDPTERVFVGVARPGFRGALDPHEDVGFLVLHPTKLEFVGTQLTFELQKASVQRVRLRMNAHTWIGMGGWVSVEGEEGGRPVRLVMEPREHWFQPANGKRLFTLRDRLRAWAAETV